MDATHSPKMTAELLRAYSEAALGNADELLVEASLLNDHRHFARAYFLAVACIEEVGKALLAFDSQNRNLSDPAVCRRLRTNIENHSQKITYALGRWATDSSDQREAFKTAADLIVHLKYGREPSMYTDLRSNPDRIQSPKGVVRAEAARDCVRLAGNTLNFARRHVREKTAHRFTRADDRLFTMKPGKIKEIFNIRDFWLYYLSRLEAGQQEISEAVLGYEQDHIEKGTQFISTQE